MKCRHCHREIHPERLAVAPRVTTCRHECAVEIKRELNRQAAQRQRDRKRQEKAVDRGSLMPKPGFAIAPPPR